MIPPLTRAIHATLAYFDQFDFPLTAEEIWRWLIVRLPDERLDLPVVSQEETFAVLQNPPTPPPGSSPGQALAKGGKEWWEQRDGYFFLPERERIVDIRRSRIPINEKKWAIARRGVRWLRFVPFIKLAGVCNTVAVSNAREESDIDVFIVAAKGKLWTARFLATALLDLLRLRRRGTAIQDRLCMSFYITEDALDLRPLLLRDGDDPYFAFWATQMVPMLDRSGTYASFIAANQWVRAYLPNAFSSTHPKARVPRLVFDELASLPLRPRPPRRAEGETGSEASWRRSGSKRALPAPPNVLRSILEALFSLSPEGFFRRLQKNKMARNGESVQNAPTTDVVISDQVLKFHERDRRREYRDTWNEKLKMQNVR